MEPIYARTTHAEIAVVEENLAASGFVLGDEAREVPETLWILPDGRPTSCRGARHHFEVAYHAGYEAVPPWYEDGDEASFGNYVDTPEPEAIINGLVRKGWVRSAAGQRAWTADLSKAAVRRTLEREAENSNLPATFSILIDDPVSLRSCEIPMAAYEDAGFRLDRALRKRCVSLGSRSFHPIRNYGFPRRLGGRATDASPTPSNRSSASLM